MKGRPLAEALPSQAVATSLPWTTRAADRTGSFVISHGLWDSPESFLRWAHHLAWHGHPALLPEHRGSDRQQQSAMVAGALPLLCASELAVCPPGDPPLPPAALPLVDVSEQLSSTPEHSSRPVSLDVAVVSGRQMRCDPRAALFLSGHHSQGLAADDFVEVVSGLIQPFKLEAPPGNRFSIHSIQLPSLHLVHIRSTSGFSICTTPNPHPYNLHIPLSQGFYDRRTGVNFSQGAGGFLPRQGAPVVMDFGKEQNQADFLCLICKPEALRTYAHKRDPDRTALLVPDAQELVMASQPGHGLHRLAPFVMQVFLAESHPWQSPLVMAELQNMILALVLEMLPRQPRPLNPTISGHQIDSKATADAAIEYMLAHLDQPLSIGCISKQVGVHPRTLHKAFRRHLHTSPMAYIKARRLEYVRKELLEADPGDLTITQSASRWGFNNPGHFAVDYRKAFGESPSATLRRY